MFESQSIRTASAPRRFREKRDKRQQSLEIRDKPNNFSPISKDKFKKNGKSIRLSRYLFGKKPSIAANTSFSMRVRRSICHPDQHSLNISSVESSPTRLLFLEKRHTLKTETENERIRQSMSDYQTILKYKAEEKESKYTVNPNELKIKFRNMSYRINSLLMGAVPIIEATSGTEYRVILNAGLRSHYKINVKKQNTPLKFRIVQSKGLGKIFFSQHIARPSITNCDKIHCLTSNNQYVGYSGYHEGDKRFTDEFVYLTFEAERDLGLVFDCVFGKQTFHKKPEKQIDTKFETESVSEEVETQIRKKEERMNFLFNITLQRLNKKYKKPSLIQRFTRLSIVVPSKQSEEKKLLGEIIILLQGIISPY